MTTFYLIVIALVLFAINVQLFHIRVWMIQMEKKLGIEDEGKTKLRISTKSPRPSIRDLVEGKEKT